MFLHWSQKIPEICENGGMLRISQCLQNRENSQPWHAMPLWSAAENCTLLFIGVRRSCFPAASVSGRATSMWESFFVSAMFIFSSRLFFVTPGNRKAAAALNMASTMAALCILAAVRVVLKLIFCMDAPMALLGARLWVDINAAWLQRGWSLQQQRSLRMAVGPG